MTRITFYRYDNVSEGKVTLTIESREGGVIETLRGIPNEMRLHRMRHYPNSHNYRHHFTGEDGCPTCDEQGKVEID